MYALRTGRDKGARHGPRWRPTFERKLPAGMAQASVILTNDLWNDNSAGIAFEN